MKRVINIFILFVVVLFIGIAIKAGYDQSWTGFSSYIGTDNKYVHYKTLWDWLSLIIVPLVLAVGAYFLNRSLRSSELSITQNQQNEDALHSYFDDISKLILEKDLYKKSEDDYAVRIIARSITITVLSRLNSKRKGSVMKFLVESKLIHKSTINKEGKIQLNSPIIELNGADLSEADLININFKDAVLDGVNFTNANLINSKLKGAEIDDTTKMNGKMKLVWQFINNQIDIDKLKGKDLSNTDFCGVSLEGYDLRGTNLRNCNLDLVDLKNTQISWNTKIEKKWHTVWKLRNSLNTTNKFSNSDFTYSFFEGAVLREYYFIESDFNYACFRFAKIEDNIFVNSILIYTDFYDSELNNIIFKSSFLLGTDFNKSKLTKIDFTKTELWDATFKCATLEDINFENVNLDGVNFEDSNLLNINFKNAININNAKFKNCKYDRNTKWPSKFNPVEHGAIFIENF